MGMLMKEVSKSASLKIRYILMSLAALFFVSTIAYIIFAYSNLIEGNENVFIILVLSEIIIVLLMADDIYKLIRGNTLFKNIPDIINEGISDGDSIFNAISDGIIITNNKGKVRSINQRLCRILGLEEKQLVNKNLYDLVNELDYYDDCKSLPLALFESLETQKEFKRKDIIFVMNNEIHYLEVSTHLLGGKSKKMTGILAVVHDVTQNRKLEQQLSRTERFVTVGQMAAELAHEIKNPICSVKGLIQIIGKKYCLEDSKYYEVITGEIDRISLLIQGFLTLAQKKPVFEIVSINKIIEEILPLVESNAESRNIDISVDIQKEIPFINADSESIRQVIMNIVQNGIDSLNSNGRININIWYDQINELVKMEFKDNGNGIKIEYLNKIFEPFFTTKDTGTGLGLAISHRIIENHCGKLFAFNNSGGGATFVIELPIANH